MKRKLFTAVCILLASAIAPCGAFAKAKKDAKKDIGILHIVPESNRE